MRSSSCAAVLMALLLPMNVAAQTSNCIAMGGGMVHCDNSDGGWTDCNAVGNTMATCNTMGGRSDDSGGEALGSSVSSLITQIQERSFRKKIGGMLAAGDCEGAARYALQKGRIEYAPLIRQSCPGANDTSSHLASHPDQPLSMILHKLATEAQIPLAVDAKTEIKQIGATDRKLLLKAIVNGSENIPETSVRSIHEFVCAPIFVEKVLNQGGIVDVNFQSSRGNDLGARQFSRPDCK